MMFSTIAHCLCERSNDMHTRMDSKDDTDTMSMKLLKVSGRLMYCIYVVVIVCVLYFVLCCLYIVIVFVCYVCVCVVCILSELLVLLCLCLLSGNYHYCWFVIFGCAYCHYCMLLLLCFASFLPPPFAFL